MKRNAVGGLVLDDGRESLVTSSGALLMNETIRVAGLRPALSRARRPWRRARARHDPGKVLLDLAIAVALGGDCLADVAAVRAQRDLFGVVASDPTVSWLFAALAVDTATTDAAVAALRVARAAAREHTWSRRGPLAGTPGTRDGGQVIVDIDATVVRAHSDKEGAEATHKMSYGFSRCAPSLTTASTAPEKLWRWTCARERPRRSIVLITFRCSKAALDQLPAVERGQVLVRADAGGASKAFVHHLTDLGLQYSIGFPAHGPVQAAIETIPEQAWVAALDSDGAPREGAQVAELTAWMPTPVKPTRSPAKYGPQECRAGCGSSPAVNVLTPAPSYA